MTCSEDFTIAVSGVGPGLVYNRVHEWGPVGYKNLRVPYATKVFARWPNGRYLEPICINFIFRVIYLVNIYCIVILTNYEILPRDS